MAQDPLITPLDKIRVLFNHYGNKYQGLGNPGIASAVAFQLNKYNPRTESKWSDKYILLLINESLPVSRYIQGAINRLYKKVIMFPIDLNKYNGIYVGPLKDSERILINFLNPEERKEALKEAAKRKKAV